MESTGHVSVPLRTGKKMKKRKELDALVANSVTKRSCVTSKRNGAGGGVSSQRCLQDQLLSDSTDEQEYWVAGATKRPRVRLTRRRPCGSLFRACSVILMFACVIATTTVLWLFIDIREQITALRSELDQVVASSQGVPDALQRCHTLSKNLQQNQTLISSQIAALKLQIENFTKEMTEMQTGLNKIQEKLNHVPEYLNVPQQLSSMSSSIANLGSQIKDITTTVASLKDSKEKLESTSNNLKQNLTDLRQSVILIQNTTQIPATVNTENNAELESMMKAIDGLKNNVSNINTTLSNNVQWIRDDQIKNKKSIESISNIGQNMSARVTTLEGICTKTQEDQITFSSGLKNLTEEYNSLLDTVKKHTSQLIGLENDVTQLSQNSSDLATAIRFLNRSISDNRFQDADGLHERELPRGTAITGSSTAASTTSTSTAAPTKPPILRE